MKTCKTQNCLNIVKNCRYNYCFAHCGKRKDKLCLEHGKRLSACKQCGTGLCLHRINKTRCLTCSPNIVCPCGKRKSDCLKCKTTNSTCSCGIFRKNCFKHSYNPENFCNSCKIFKLSKYNRENKITCHSCRAGEDKHKRVELEFLDLFHSWGYFPTSHDKIIRNTECQITNTHDNKRNLKRIDYFFRTTSDISYHIIIECDEHSHSGYDISCEMKRLQDVSDQIISNLANDIKPIAVIRFNPFNVNKQQLQETMKEAFSGSFEIKDARGFEIICMLGYSTKRIIEYNNNEITKRINL